MTNIDSTDKIRLSAWASRRLIGLAVFVASWLGYVWRRPDQWMNPQFWVEDGTVFFSDAATLGWAALLKPHAGYLHLAPRIVAALTRSIPWEFLPVIYVLAASVIVALVGMRIACARLPLLERLLAAIALVAVPHGGEVFLTITNAQWILNALLVVNLLEPPPENAREMYRRSFELLVAGLSGPMTLVLAPFALLWSWRWRRSNRARLLMGTWLISLIVQAVVLGSSERVIGASLRQMLLDLRWVVPQYSAAFFVGRWCSYFLVLGWLAASGGVIVLGVLFSDRTNRRRWPGLFMLLAAVTLLISGRMGGAYWPNPLGAAARYTYLPFVLVMWTFASLASGTGRRLHRLLALSMYGLVIWSAASAWTAPPLPPNNWAQQVREAKAGQRRLFTVAPNIDFPVPPGLRMVRPIPGQNSVVP